MPCLTPVPKAGPFASTEPEERKPNTPDLTELKQGIRVKVISAQRENRETQLLKEPQTNKFNF